MSVDFWAGYISGAASIIVGNPLDLIKVRLQSTNQSISTAYPRGWQSVRTFTAGLPAPILTYGVLNAILFMSYNRTLNLLVRVDDQKPSRKDDSRHPLWSYFLAGAAAGFATFFISTPTEFIKCRAQVGPTPGQSNFGQPILRRNSSFNIATQVIRERGVRGLFLGGAITSFRDAIGYGFWFLTYEATKDFWSKRSKRSMTGGNSSSHGSGSSQEAIKVLLCGGTAGVVTWTSVYPLDVIKTRVQTQPLPLHGPSPTESLSNTTNGKKYYAVVQEKGAWPIAKEVYATEGYRFFWRGMSVCCMRAFLVNAVQWLAYEHAMQYFSLNV